MIELATSALLWAVSTFIFLIIAIFIVALILAVIGGAITACEEQKCRTAEKKYKELRDVQKINGGRR